MKKYMTICLTLLWCVVGYTQNRTDNKVNNPAFFSLKGFYADLKDGDTVELKVCDAIYASNFFFRKPRDYADFNKIRIFKATVKNGHFTFSIKDLTRSAYCNLYLAPKEGVPSGLMDQLIEPGDDVQIIFSGINKNNVSKKNKMITGKGSAKYNFTAITDTLVLKKSGTYKETSSVTFKLGSKNKIMEPGVKEIKRATVANIKFNQVTQNKRKLDTCLSILEHLKSALSPISYDILKANVLGEYVYATFERGLLFDLIDLMMLKKQGDLSTESLKNVDAELDALKLLVATSRIDFNNFGISEEGLKLSIGADQSLLSLINIDRIFSGISKDDSFYTVAKIRPFSLREKVFICFFTRYNGSLEKPETLVNLARPMIKNPENLKVFSGFENTGRGMTAYNFSLQDENGKMHSMVKMKGKVVLIDFWYVGCGACKNYYDLVLKDVERQFNGNKNVLFVTISPTKKDEWLKKGLGEFTSKDEANVINLNTGEDGYNAAVIKHYNVRGYPFPLLIDKDGKIFENNGTGLRSKEFLIAAINNALKKKS
ncbi:hypothetical protein DBR43_09835 [Pedobacter sp. KBW06]|uniref:TlpA family protein disulfide reductase n=1 Tax=Pedobacter sp. KBW06 TaxID=2153359 RepID=UPI000F5A03D9|nr:TlpA disulfide reductase family protein [Pedobacter sp. KBW06]RQO75628.1 hypothetical protein DBR43_09835 [Pedobacter sp. KBW06]